MHNMLKPLLYLNATITQVITEIILEMHNGPSWLSYESVYFKRWFWMWQLLHTELKNTILTYIITSKTM